MTPSVRARLAWIVGLVVVTIGLVIALRTLDAERIVAAITHASAPWLIAAVICNVGILCAIGAFWRVLSPRDARVSYWRMFEIAAIATAVMNTIPFMAGHATGVALLIKRAQLSLRSALTVLALDQLGEGIVKVSVCLAVALFAPLPGWIHAGFIAITIAVAVLLVVLVVVANTRTRWAEGLAALRDVRHGLLALVLVAMSKAMEGFGIAAVQHAFGLSFGVPAVLLVLAAVLLATMIPVSPGNLGAYEAAAFFVYRYLGVAAELALVLAIVQHLCFMASSVGVGYALGARRALRG
ncbi:MAG TPA: lysylphosphatidylglycerol synthase transmembrane domain-containing protein [Gemmatimonadaceae bacterium]|nr:lysylphosphatidylglycerol synthase transmembrane domain-containing protein [Gemmatimonadaceae bacterium]